MFIQIDLITCCSEGIVFILFWRIFFKKQKRWFFLLSSGESRPNCSLVEKTLSTLPFRLLMNFTAQFCIISTLFMLALVCGFMTTSVLCHISIGLRKPVHTNSLASLEALYVRCLMPPRTFFSTRCLFPSYVCQTWDLTGWSHQGILCCQSNLELYYQFEYKSIESMGFFKLVVNTFFHWRTFSIPLTTNWPHLCFCIPTNLVQQRVISGETNMVKHTLR